MVLVVLHNLILITLMVWRWGCHKPSINFYPGHHNELKDYHFDRFSDILLTFTGFLHIPEHIYLLVNLYKFIGIYIKWNEGYRKDILDKMKDFARLKKKNAPYDSDTVSNDIGEDVSGLRQIAPRTCVTPQFKRARILLNGIVLMLMLSVVLALPSMSIARIHIHSNKTEEHCSKKVAFAQNSLMHAFHGVSFFTNTVVALTRFLMVFFTVMIGVMWRRVKPCSEDSVPFLHESSKHEAKRVANSPRVPECETTFQQPQDPGHEGDFEKSGHNREDTNLHKSGHKANNQDPRAPPKVGDWEDVCSRHTDRITEYMAIKDNVFPIYKIFRSFFVLQWIIHLAGLFCHIAYLLRPWVRNGPVDVDEDADMLIVTHQVYQSLHVLYNGLALVISYICALKMNTYLGRYVRDEQEKQLEEGRKANSTIQYSLTHLFLIKVESVSKSSFLPRIPGTGLNISVESPGFVLSIVFSLFALIGTLISF